MEFFEKNCKKPLKFQQKYDNVLSTRYLEKR